MRRRGPCAGDRGDTLVELIVAVAILGLSIVAILGALADEVKGTTLHREMATVRTIVASAAEYVKAHPADSCSIAVPESAVSVPPHVTLDVRLWGHLSDRGEAVPDPTCDATDSASVEPPRPRVYEIDVKGRLDAAESLQVVVR